MSDLLFATFAQVSSSSEDKEQGTATGKKAAGKGKEKRRAKSKRGGGIFDVADDDLFVLNDKFSNPKHRLVVPLVSAKPSVFLRTRN